MGRAIFWAVLQQTHLVTLTFGNKKSFRDVRQCKKGSNLRRTTKQLCLSKYRRCKN
jgi:hypothetical protein